MVYARKKSVTFLFFPPQGLLVATIFCFFNSEVSIFSKLSATFFFDLTQNMFVFVVILNICLSFVCLGARCVAKALEPVPHPVWQHIYEPGRPAFRILHGLLHDRSPSMLQHWQPHGDSKRQEFSQSGEHHSPIRQPVHVRNSLTSGRTASWRAPLTEMCAYRTYIWTLWTVDPRKPFILPLGFSDLQFMDGNWRKYCILFGILKSREHFPQWSTMENITHCQSFWFLWLKWRWTEEHNLMKLFFFMALRLIEGWATLMHWMMVVLSMDLWIILAQRNCSKRKE